MLAAAVTPPDAASLRAAAAMLLPPRHAMLLFFFFELSMMITVAFSSPPAEQIAAALIAARVYAAGALWRAIAAGAMPASARLISRRGAWRSMLAGASGYAMLPLRCCYAADAKICCQKRGRYADACYADALQRRYDAICCCHRCCCAADAGFSLLTLATLLPAYCRHAIFFSDD